MELYNVIPYVIQLQVLVFYKKRTHSGCNKINIFHITQYKRDSANAKACGVLVYACVSALYEKETIADLILTMQ